MYWTNRLLSKVECIWLLLINETETISIDTLSGKDIFTIHTDTHEKRNNNTIRKYCSKYKHTNISVYMKCLHEYDSIMVITHQHTIVYK